MESGIIKFYSGSAQQVANITATNCIIFNQTDGSLSWKRNGHRYYISMPTNVNADWNQNDPNEPAYIKNKPTIYNYTIPTDLNQLSDSTFLAHSKRKPINLNTVQSGNKVLLGTRRPSQLITDRGKIYSVQTDSLQLDNNNNYKIDLTRYLAYQNIPIVQGQISVPDGWYLLYNGGPV